MKKFMPACFLALLLAVPAAAQAERIRSSDSRFTVNTDGSMQVVDTIVIEFAGINIVHGIYRDFPTSSTALGSSSDSGGRGSSGGGGGGGW